MHNRQVIYWCTSYKICTMTNSIIDRIHDTMLLLCTTLFAYKKKNVHI